MILDGKSVLITGGTGSLGRALVRLILDGRFGNPERVTVFSRDEAKQHDLRVSYLHRRELTDDVIYRNSQQILRFRIGDVRDYHSVCATLRHADIVINAAALKQVPSCEYFPYEAVQTNITGAENIVRAIRENDLSVETVVGVSTDKACKPVNVMGMTKALQERIFIAGNITAPGTRFICVRYGNVLASRGSVIPLFHDQIRNGGPVTVTTGEMTRFLLPLERAVDTICAALEGAEAGETFVPKVPASRMLDVARALIGDRAIETVVTGIRPGEKVHEIMVSEEEGWRAFDRGDYYAIQPMLPELAKGPGGQAPLAREYSSADSLMTLRETVDLLERNGLLLAADNGGEGELLR